MSDSFSLRVFASIAVFGEAIMLAVLPPLLPQLVSELSLSGAAVGVVSASYSAGVLLGTLPGGMAESRLGARTGARLGVGLIALGSLGFAVAARAPELAACRLVAGVGAAVAWAGALAWVALSAGAARRGAAFGGVIGAAFAGTLTAPALALAAHHFGRLVVFVPLAVGFGLVALWGGPPNARPESSGVGTRYMLALLRDHAVAVPLTVMLLLGVVLGTMMSAGPLLLSHRGIADGTIALVFLAGYGPQLVITPIVGRVVDRFGPRAMLFGLLAVAAVLLPVVGLVTQQVLLIAAFVVLYSVALSAWVPVSVWVSQATEANAGSQGFAVALTNGAWGLGSMIGAITMSIVATEVSFPAAFAIGAIGAIVAALVARRTAA